MMDVVPGVAYGISKAGGNYLVRRLHLDHEKEGVVSVALSPGYVFLYPPCLHFIPSFIHFFIHLSIYSFTHSWLCVNRWVRTPMGDFAADSWNVSREIIPLTVEESVRGMVEVVSFCFFSFFYIYIIFFTTTFWKWRHELAGWCQYDIYNAYG